MVSVGPCCQVSLSHPSSSRHCRGWVFLIVRRCAKLERQHEHVEQLTTAGTAVTHSRHSRHSSDIAKSSIDLFPAMNVKEAYHTDRGMLCGYFQDRRSAVLDFRPQALSRGESKSLRESLAMSNELQFFNLACQSSFQSNPHQFCERPSPDHHQPAYLGPSDADSARQTSVMESTLTTLIWSSTSLNIESPSTAIHKYKRVYLSQITSDIETKHQPFHFRHTSLSRQPD